MKSKHGFTLIELLAVIVILAIILAIAIPSITNIIENSQVNALKSNEKMLLKAAKLYVGTNDSALPTNIGDTKEIALSTLQTNGYLATIKDPIDRTTACNGYVIITKTDTSEYDYTPYLNCENNIGTRAADNLVAHYQFDDMQEPTVNLVTNGDMSQGLNGWLDNQSITKSLISRDAKTYLKVISAQTGSTPGVRFNDITVTASTNYTFSVTLKTSLNNVMLWVTNASNTQIALKENLQANNSFDTKTSVSFNSGTDTTVRVWVLFSGAAMGDWFEMTDVQLEAKSYATPFVNGTRTGIVKDYSGNNHSASLQLSSTPKWTNDSKVGSGAYKFNGIDQFISVNLSKPNYPFTLALWARREDAFPSADFVSIAGWRYISESLQGICYYTDYRITYKDYGGNSALVYSDNLMEINKWNYIVITHDNTNLKIYINGLLVKTAAQTISPYSSNELQIGATKYQVGQNRAFEGTIDDVRIYSRALSADEVKQLYNASK